MANKQDEKLMEELKEIANIAKSCSETVELDAKDLINQLGTAVYDEDDSIDIKRTVEDFITSADATLEKGIRDMDFPMKDSDSDLVNKVQKDITEIKYNFIRARTSLMDIRSDDDPLYIMDAVMSIEQIVRV